MPTLDRRLLTWSDSDMEDDGERLPTTPASRRGLDACGGSYDDRAAGAAVDDVLVPTGADDDDGRAGTRKALAAAGLVAGGLLCAYLAWRCCGSMAKLPASS